MGGIQDDYTGFGSWAEGDDSRQPEPDAPIDVPTPQHVDAPSALPKPKALPEMAAEDTEPRLQRAAVEQPGMVEKTGRSERTGPQPKAKPPRRPAQPKSASSTLSWRGQLVQTVNRALTAILIVLSLAVVAAAAYRFVWDDNDSDGNHQPQQETSALPTPTNLPQGNWPPGVPAIENTTPAMIKNTLVAPNERQGYLFQGEAGQTWTITVETIADDSGLYNLDPKCTLYDPTGQEIGSADDISADNFDAELVIVLPTTGAYRLLVESSAEGTTTGRYLLTLWVN